MGTMRLQTFLSRSGIASRRASAEIVQTGRVAVNKKIVMEPGYPVTDTDLVSLDNTIVTREEEKIYLIFNKPPMVISSAHDPQGRVTIMDIVQKSFPQRLFPVGRLDYLSTGLIFITNDGDFSYRVSHPRSNYLRKYEVSSSEKIPRKMLQDWQSGVRIMGENYRLHNFHYQSPKSVVLGLTEGKNREIRNVFANNNIPITSLHRIQFGMQHLANLKIGSFRLLANKEVETLLKTQKTTSRKNN